VPLAAHGLTIVFDDGSGFYPGFHSDCKPFQTEGLDRGKGMERRLGDFIRARCAPFGFSEIRDWEWFNSPASGASYLLEGEYEVAGKFNPAGTYQLIPKGASRGPFRSGKGQSYSWYGNEVAQGIWQGKQDLHLLRNWFIRASRML